MAELRVKSTGTLKLFESDNTSSVTIASPASLGGDRTVTLPDADVTLVSGTMSTGLTAADITGQTALGAEPADTDEFVLSDAGVLKRVDYSYLKAANTPAFEAYSSVDQTSIADATWTTVEFGTELYDSDGCYDTTTFRFTPTTAGKYFTYASCNLNSGSYPTMGMCGITIKKNTSNVTYALVDHRGNVTGRSGYPNTITTVDMNGTSDYLNVTGWMTPGGTFASGSYVTYFGAYKLIT